ncbi:hypothetical protein [Virgibacillus phasianinus]|uniref:hypothetical protein n=1 Tax=Virgibacillus phasianinus TaxID=2017483 RepID=UPI0012FE1BED|nr:hypothetical protein [Virgibacillus phasianinus]
MGKQRLERKRKHKDDQERQYQEIDRVEFASEHDFIDEINLKDNDRQHHGPNN